MAQQSTTTRLSIPLQQPLDASLKEELDKKILYISEGIRSFETVVDDGRITAVDLEVEPGLDQDELSQHINRTVVNDVAQLRNVTTSRVWESDRPCGDGDRVFEELCQARAFTKHGKGQVGIRVPYLDVLEFFDDLLSRLAVDVFQGVEYRFPTLIRTSVLNRVGYFESFPNLLFFVSRLKNSLSNYTRFRGEFADISSEEDVPERLSHFTVHTEYSLPPTMCYYVYDMFSNAAFEGNRCVTTVGKSFRYENDYCRTMERLWDFAIRETVFLGDLGYVRGGVARCLEIATRLMDELGLAGFCETANDPFFLVQDTAQRINAQKVTGSKYELRLRISPHATIAVASFNRHGTYLAKRFGIHRGTDANQFINTGCVGFGLERMLFAFLAQFGTDEEAWPAPVREYRRRKREAEDVFLPLIRSSSR